MKKYCIHTHTYRCGHAIGEDTEYIEKAIVEGFDVYGYSDHIMFPNIYQPRVRGSFDQLPYYLDSINQIKRRYGNQIEIHLGMEAEFYPEFLDFYKELFDKYKIEYLIMGEHFVYSKGSILPFDYLNSPQEILKTYVDYICQGMSTGLFSVLAHPDLFAFWYVERDEFFYEQIDRLIDAAIKYDVVLELNISKIEINRRHNVEFPKEMAPFPIDLFWKRVAKKKANVIIGLDCHDPYYVRMESFNYGNQLAKEYGLHVVDIDYVIKKFRT